MLDGGAAPAAIGAEGWEEGGEISMSRQSNSNYSLTVVSACPYIVCLSVYV